jgi:hypothetical protein
MARAVAEVNDNAFRALPLGPVIDFIVGLLYDEDLPPVAQEKLGFGVGSLKSHLFSRPYVASRDEPCFTDDACTELGGQVRLFDYLGEEARARAEDDAVTHFETLPLFHDTTGAGELKDALNQRGPNFMGCKHPGRRGCWE